MHGCRPNAKTNRTSQGLTDHQIFRKQQRRLARPHHQPAFRLLAEVSFILFCTLPSAGAYFASTPAPPPYTVNEEPVAPMSNDDWIPGWAKVGAGPRPPPFPHDRRTFDAITAVTAPPGSRQRHLEATRKLTDAEVTRQLQARRAYLEAFQAAEEEAREKFNRDNDRRARAVPKEEAEGIKVEITEVEGDAPALAADLASFSKAEALPFSMPIPDNYEDQVEKVDPDDLNAMSISVRIISEEQVANEGADSDPTGRPPTFDFDPADYDWNHWTEEDDSEPATFTFKDLVDAEREADLVKAELEAWTEEDDYEPATFTLEDLVEADREENELEEELATFVLNDQILEPTATPSASDRSWEPGKPEWVFEGYNGLQWWKNALEGTAHDEFCLRFGLHLLRQEILGKLDVDCRPYLPDIPITEEGTLAYITPSVLVRIGDSMSHRMHCRLFGQMLTDLGFGAAVGCDLEPSNDPVPLEEMIPSLFTMGELCDFVAKWEHIQRVEACYPPQEQGPAGADSSVDPTNKDSLAVRSLVVSASSASERAREADANADAAEVVEAPAVTPRLRREGSTDAGSNSNGTVSTGVNDDTPAVEALPLPEPLQQGVQSLRGRLGSWTHLAPPLDPELAQDLAGHETGSPRRGKRAIGLSNRELIFSGYDCSVPDNLTTVAAGEPAPCRTRVAQADKEEGVFLLLQKARRHWMPIRRCSLSVTRMVHVCSPAASHTTLVTAEWVFDEVTPISYADCEQIWETQSLTNPYNHEEKWYIGLNSTTHVMAFKRGYEAASHYDNHCRGGGFSQFRRMQYWPNQVSKGIKGILNNAVEAHHYRITTEEVWATTDEDGTIRVATEDITLPCKDDQERCVTKQRGTFLWNQPDGRDRCPMYKTRHEPLLGYIMHKDGQRVFLSGGDKSMVRLELKEQRAVCGSIVYSTDFPNLFLTREIGYDLFQRDLHPSETSLASYVNLQDSFLFDELLTIFKATMSDLQNMECQYDQKKQETELARKAAEQRSMVDGDTTRLWGNQYVTSSGEVFFRYGCRPIEVRARTTEKCFNALPVTLKEEDFRHYISVRRSGKRRPDGVDQPAEDLALDRLTPDSFFLEPSSRRLTVRASPIRCVSPFAPRYRNINGRWIAYESQRFVVAPDPFIIDDLDWAVEMPLVNNSYDWHDGGLYDPDFINNYEAWSQTPHAGLGVMTALSSNVKPFIDMAENSGGPQASSFFPDLENLPGSEALQYFSWVWELFKAYGNLCSIVVGTVLLFRCFSWAGGVAFRLFTGPIHGNICLHVIGAFFPSFRDCLRNPVNTCAACLGYPGRRRRRSNASEREAERRSSVDDDFHQSQPPNDPTKTNRIIEHYSHRTAVQTAALLSGQRGGVTTTAPTASPSSPPLYPSVNNE